MMYNLAMKRILAIGTVLLLLGADWLAFHDWSEVHSLRDWLMLAATVTAIIYFLLTDSSAKRTV